MEHYIVEGSAFVDGYDKLSEATRSLLYDRGADETPALGGTTTTIYNPLTGDAEKQFLSLAGTEINCAGGPTPWGSWLSCEECFRVPGSQTEYEHAITRDQPHGYVFEVSSQAEGLAAAEPIKAMGTFEHEACAVHADTGIVYMTEDRYHSLFYRFIPNVPGKLQAGGRLQALALDNHSSVMTHNWSSRPQTMLNTPMKTRWIDLPPRGQEIDVFIVLEDEAGGNQHDGSGQVDGDSGGLGESSHHSLLIHSILPVY